MRRGCDKGIFGGRGAPLPRPKMPAVRGARLRCRGMPAGTVGDMESLPFIESLRQLRQRVRPPPTAHSCAPFAVTQAP